MHRWLRLQCPPRSVSKITVPFADAQIPVPTGHLNTLAKGEHRRVWKFDRGGDLLTSMQASLGLSILASVCRITTPVPWQLHSRFHRTRCKLYPLKSQAFLETVGGGLVRKAVPWREGRAQRNSLEHTPAESVKFLTPGSMLMTLRSLVRICM